MIETPTYTRDQVKLADKVWRAHRSKHPTAVSRPRALILLGGHLDVSREEAERVLDIDQPPSHHLLVARRLAWLERTLTPWQTLACGGLLVVAFCALISAVTQDWSALIGAVCSYFGFLVLSAYIFLTEH